MLERVTVMWACLLAGCAGAEVKSEPPRSSPGAGVSLELRTAGGRGWQSVGPGASLDSGTEFAVSVAISQESYLFVGQRASGAELTLLYPSPQSASVKVRAEPNQPIQVPDSGQWFRLDNQPGEESIFVLVSTKPQELATARQLLAERGDAACVKTRDPPPPNVRSRDRDNKVHATMGDDGFAVLCLPFRHSGPVPVR